MIAEHNHYNNDGECPACERNRTIEFIFYVVVVTIFFLMGFVDFPKGQRW